MYTAASLSDCFVLDRKLLPRSVSLSCIWCIRRCVCLLVAILVNCMLQYTALLLIMRGRELVLDNLS